MRGVISFLVLAMLVRPALAERASWGAQIFDLSLPRGHCAYQTWEPFDAAQIEAQQAGQPGGSRILLLSAPCAELAAARRGEAVAFSEWAQWILAGGGTKPRTLPRDIPREAVLEALVGELPRIHLQALNRAISESPLTRDSTVEVQATRILDQDRTALYLALGARFTQNGTSRDVAWVQSMLPLRGWLLSLSVYTTRAADEAHDRLLEIARPLAAEALVRNEAVSSVALKRTPDTGLWWAPDRTIERGLSGIVIAGLVGAFVGSIGWGLTRWLSGRS